MRVSRLLVLLLIGPVTACDSGSNTQENVTATRVVMRPYVPVPPGSVPKGAGERAARLATGSAPNEAVIARGRERFLAFCSPCHGASGYGNGPVTRHGFPPPPSYHLQRLKEAPPAHIVAVITNGLGRMYSYADRVSPEERWAIAHYVKALQANPPPAPEEIAAPAVPRGIGGPGRIGIPPAGAAP